MPHDVGGTNAAFTLWHATTTKTLKHLTSNILTKEPKTVRDVCTLCSNTVRAAPLHLVNVCSNTVRARCVLVIFGRFEVRQSDASQWVG